MASVIRRALNDFPQTNTIIKTGKELLMSGELDLNNLDGANVSVECLIIKKKRNLNQQVEGNVNSFPAYLIAESLVSPTIETHDLLIQEDGKVWIVGAASIKNNNIGIQTRGLDASYLYADLELWED